MREINGKTSVYGIIGNPVEHSLSPLLQNDFFEVLGINGVYVAFNVASSLEKAIAGAHALGIKGLNVTLPYKKDVMPYLCEVDESALRVGAVNTLLYTENGYKGYNTDLFGVIKTFEKYNISFENRAALVLGAGGAAYACGFAAAMSGAKSIYIANRSNNNSELLATQIKKYYNDIEVNLIGVDKLAGLQDDFFILQATSVGMDCVSSPIDDLSVIERSGGVLDVIYSPPKTKILEDSEKLGKLSINGLDMLVFQAVCAFQIWNGVIPDAESIKSSAFNILRD